MDGVEFNDPGYAGPQPVDFILEDNGNAVVMFAGWWANPYWGPGDGMDVFQSSFVPLLGDPPKRWRVESRSEVWIGQPSDASMVERVKRMRYYQDIERERYYAALDDLSAFLDGDFYDLHKWRELMAARPTRDVVQEMLEQNTGTREVSIISLLGAGDVVIDTLVLDKNGNAGTATKTSWLEGVAAMWSEMDTPSDMKSFVAWVMEQRPSGIVASLIDPVVRAESGDVESIARRHNRKARA
jgi:hypothetical protein